MKHLLAIILVAVMVFGIDYSSEAQKTISKESQISIGGQLGIALPMGDFGDIANTGFGFQGLFGYALAPSIDFRATLGYFTFGGKDDIEDMVDYSISDIPILVGITYKLGTLGLTPYVGAELGIHNLTVKYKVLGYNYDASESKFGFGLFGGVMYPVNQQISIIGDVKFTYISTEGSATNHIGINAGVMYNL